MPSRVAILAQLAGGTPGFPRATWATGSAFYAVLSLPGGGIVLFKSTDGSNWAQQDQANIPPNFIEAAYSAWLHTNGFLYVFYTSTTSYTYAIRRFDTATDLWETSDFTGTDVSVNVGDQASVRIVVCPNNEIVCFYQHVSTLAPTIRRWDGASWGSEMSLEATDGRPLDMIVDGSDRLVLAWEDVTNHAQKYVTIDNTGVIGSIDTFDPSVNASPTISSLMCRFNDGANDCIAILSRDTGGELDCHYGVEGATLGGLTTVDAISTISPASSFVGLTFFAGQVYASWSAPIDVSVYAIYSAVSTSLSPLAFGPERVYTPGPSVNLPQWIGGLGALGFFYHYNNPDTGNIELYVEWIVQPNGYQPWPANDTSQVPITATRMEQ